MRLFFRENAIGDLWITFVWEQPGLRFIGYGGTTESVYSYNYVDSSYIQMLFYYGVVPVVLLVLIYVLASKRILQTGYVPILSFIIAYYN